jgi:hypothetical protein
MGLDILIVVNNYEELHSADYYAEEHSLSRTFCKLMLRHCAIDHEPEFNQIGKITEIDISPIFEMENYKQDEELEFFVMMADSEEEKQKILNEAEENKANLQGNIDRVTKTVTALIEKLNTIDNLPSLLLPTDSDTLENEDYFSAFQTDQGESYRHNNFGQDLRNFKRFLEFAKAHGTTTVWFEYG